MKLRLARKIAVTRTQRRGTVSRALRRLQYGKYVIIHRWWHWELIRRRMESFA